MHDIWGIIWLFILLAANAFFVGSEFAVISVKRSQLEPSANSGNKFAARALWCLDHVNLMLATTQLGITVCSLLILNVSEPAIHHLLNYPLSAIGLPEAVTDTLSFLITLVLVSYLHVVFGEMVPKNLSFSEPERAALLLTTPLIWLSTVSRPIVFSLNWLANHLVRLIGMTPRDSANTAFTLEQVATIVDESTREGTLDDAAGTVSNAFEFTERIVGDVAVPLTDVTILPPAASASDVERAVAKFGYSRYLVDGPNGDGPIGYVHVKDVLDLEHSAWTTPLPSARIRPLANVDGQEEVEDALTAMQRSGAHVAGVFTGTALTGVLFFEDIVEVLVGEVHDATTRH